MKFPQLRCQLTIFCSLLLWTISSYGQILTLPILSSYFGSGPIISICDSETVTFTATGDVGVSPLNFEFKIVRAGGDIYPLGVGRSQTASFSYNLFQDGDQVIARVWTYDNGGANTLTNTITIALESFPERV